MGICLIRRLVVTDNNKVYIYTDGACSGNPGPGGWCAILVYNGRERMLSGGNKTTTNNRMELTAVIEGLNALKRPCEVKIVTDSKYIVDAVNKQWLLGWKARGWIKSDKKPVLNVEMWKELDILLCQHRVEFLWIKGHNGYEYNVRCDKEAVRQSSLFLI